MDIEYIINRIKEEGREYIESHNTASDWLAIPEHILRRVLIDAASGVANVQSRIDREGFDKGVIYACARMIEMHDQPTMALEIYDEAGIVDETVASEYDLQYLRKYRPSIGKGKI